MDTTLISIKMETADIFQEGVWVGKMPLTNEQFAGSGSTLRSKVKEVMGRNYKSAKKRSTMAKSILWNYIPVGCDKAILGEIKYNGGIKIICEEIKDALTDKHRQQAIDYLQKVYDNLSGPNGKNERFNQEAVKATVADAKAAITILKNSSLRESTEMIEEATQQPYKSYPNTYIGQKIASGGESIEKPLIKYIMNAERLNKGSEAFRQIQNDIKTRQTSAILYRVLMMPNVVLAMDVKELPASFKVFRAADVRASNKEPKIFIDVTGIVKLNNGIFICNKIDTLITYLTGALVQLLYYDPSKQLTNNASITRPATVCFVKLFTGVIDELRVIGYAENQLKIKYSTAIYFLTSLVGKPMENARSMAANILSINPKEAKAYDYYYSDEAMKDLNTFVTDLCENFHLRGFGTDIILDRWMFKYGKGTMYGLELYPSFLMMLTNAYCGAYVNQQKTIEKYCGRDMVDISTTLIRVGADIYSEGAYYQKDEYGNIILR